MQQKFGNNNIRGGAQNRMDYRGRGGEQVLKPGGGQAALGVGEQFVGELTVFGLGVPAGCGEKIFEQFYRAHDSLSNGIQGSGLGLTLARQIARAHGGDVVYEARQGGGSCFTLRLPVMEPVKSEVQSPKPEMRSPST